MFSSVNILDELVKIRQKHAHTLHALTEQADDSVKKGIAVDEFLLKRIRTVAKPGKWKMNTDVLDKNKVFSLDDIKMICVQYRLRCIDTKDFKREELSADSLAILKNVEKETGKEVTQLKIVASAKILRLNSTDKDPLLFAALDDTNFYLIHSWSTNFAWYKKLLLYPMRSIWTLLLSLIIVGLPLMFIIPALWFHTAEDVLFYQNLYLAGFTIYLAFTMVFGGFTFYKKFSRVCWNSPYFN